MENAGYLTVEELEKDCKDNDWFFDAKMRTLSLEKLLKRSINTIRKNIAGSLYILKNDLEFGQPVGEFCEGQCAVLTTDGYVITNYHCAPSKWDTNSINRKLYTPNLSYPIFDPLIRVELPEHDLLLLRLLSPKTEGKPSAKLSASGPRVGQIVDFKSQEKQTRGKIIKVRDLSMYNMQNAPSKDVAVASTFGIKGTSGTPVFNKKNELTGVVSLTMNTDWSPEVMKIGYGNMGIRKVKYIKELIKKAIEEIPKITF